MKVDIRESLLGHYAHCCNAHTLRTVREGSEAEHYDGYIGHYVTYCCIYPSLRRDYPMAGDGTTLLKWRDESPYGIVPHSLRLWLAYCIYG